MRVNVSDPLQFNRANVSVAYSPVRRPPARNRCTSRPSTSATTGRRARRTNDADFYDLFGPTKVSRKGYSIGLGHTNTLIFDEPRAHDAEIKGRVAGNLDQLPEYQNVAGESRSTRDLSRDAQVHVRPLLARPRRRREAADVDGGAGRRLRQLVDVLPRARRTTWGWPCRSVTRRSGCGTPPVFSPRRSELSPSRTSTSAASATTTSITATRSGTASSSTFPARELNEIGGRNFARTMIEWNLPPMRFKRAGTPGAYLSWLQAGALRERPPHQHGQRPDRRKAGSFGGQVDLRFTVLSALDMTSRSGAPCGPRPACRRGGKPWCRSPC